MVDPGFYATVRKMIAEHPFVPTTGNEKVRNCEREKSRQYEQSEKRKESHRKWNQSPAGKESSARRSSKYAKSHPEKRRENSKRFYERHKAEISERRKQKRLEKRAKNIS